MFAPLPEGLIAELTKVALEANARLELRLEPGETEVRIPHLFECFNRAIQREKDLPEDQRRIENINSLGILFGQFIVWVAEWSWAWYYSDPESKPDMAELCVTDPNEHYVVFPLRDTSSVYAGTAHTLELQFRMIINKKLPPPNEGELIILSPD